MIRDTHGLESLTSTFTVPEILESKTKVNRCRLRQIVYSSVWLYYKISGSKLEKAKSKVTLCPWCNKYIGTDEQSFVTVAIKYFGNSAYNLPRFRALFFLSFYVSRTLWPSHKCHTTIHTSFYYGLSSSGITGPKMFCPKNSAIDYEAGCLEATGQVSFAHCSFVPI